MAAEYDLDKSAAASKSRKRWDDSELTHLIQLRTQYPDVTWEQFERIYNGTVILDNRRTQDGLSCKWNSLSVKGPRQRRCPQSRSKPRRIKQPSITQSKFMSAIPQKSNVHSQCPDQLLVVSGAFASQAEGGHHQSPSETGEIVGNPIGARDRYSDEGDWFGLDGSVTGGSGSGSAQSCSVLPYPSQVLESWRLLARIDSATR